MPKPGVNSTTSNCASAKKKKKKQLTRTKFQKEKTDFPKGETKRKKNHYNAKSLKREGGGEGYC